MRFAKFVKFFAAKYYCLYWQRRGPPLYPGPDVSVGGDVGDGDIGGWIGVGVGPAVEFRTLPAPGDALMGISSVS